MNNEEAKFGHSFNLINNMNIVRLKRVFDAFQCSFHDAWQASDNLIREKISDKNLTQLILENRVKINPEKEWEIILSQNKDLKIITQSDEDYPLLLKETPFAPFVLYVLGNIKALSSNYSVSLVGTRRATYYGREISFKLGRELAEKGINVVSGLALGIDTEAHRGCVLGGGKTFAVLGSGIFNIHPKTNLGLAKKIVESDGAVISEYPPNLQADKWTFPQRNRIIAGLSQLTVVIEAPEKSGALITANFALDYNRDVGVTPGEISSLNSKGSNRLLKSGAFSILEVSDILEILGAKEKEVCQEKLFDEAEQKILNLINNPISSDELFLKCGLDAQLFNQKLSILEIKGAIRNYNGKFEKVDLMDY